MTDSSTPSISAAGARPGTGAAHPAGRDGTRVAVIGTSTRVLCGVRDHATLLAEGLERAGASCSLYWCSRKERALRAAASELRAWTRELEAQLEVEGADVALLHYSAFSYSHRGVPVFLHPVLSALARARVPLLSMLHELVYPWNYAGLRGKVWALSQRTLLIELVRASAGIVVTEDFEARWLASRPWLPRRPVAVAAVFSNLPPPADCVRPAGSEPAIGLFGYAYERAAAPLVLDALAILRRRGMHARQRLLGAPGASSAAADEWREGARARELDEQLSFLGPLPAQELSDALAACEVLLVSDESGPSSRKGTLAGSLASGRPVVAIDGSRSWRRVVEQGAVALVQPNAGALADCLQELLSDTRRRESLGALGRSFAEREMGLNVTVRAITELLDVLPPNSQDARGESP